MVPPNLRADVYIQCAHTHALNFKFKFKFLLIYVPAGRKQRCSMLYNFFFCFSNLIINVHEINIKLIRNFFPIFVFVLIEYCIRLPFPTVCHVYMLSRFRPSPLFNLNCASFYQYRSIYFSGWWIIYATISIEKSQCKL